MTERHSSNDVAFMDSEYAFVIKSLFYPFITVVFLIACVLLNGRPIHRADFLIATLAFVGVSELLDIPELQHSAPPQRQILRILNVTTRWITIGSGIAIVLYMFGLSAAIYDSAVLWWFILTPLLILSGAAAMRTLLQYSLERRPPRNAVIVGTTDAGSLLSAMLDSRPLMGVKALGIFSDRSDERLAANRLPVLGRLADVASFVSSHNVYAVYITLPMSRDVRVVRLLESLQNTTASVYFIPNVTPLGSLQSRFDVVHGIPMIAVCETPFYGVRGIMKRLTDILLSASALLLISPLLAVIAIGIKLSSPGPVIFKQVRYGLDGREIMIYKFRSMSVTENGSSDYTQVTRHDGRVTRFGALLRRTSCDELPQLLNVLEGSMSLVGPRPHAVAVNEHYRRLIPGYMIRHKIKPGITGWAQVNGYRGGDDLPSMKKRIEFDLYYLDNWSLSLDFLIFFRTFGLLVKDSHAY